MAAKTLDAPGFGDPHQHSVPQQQQQMHHQHQQQHQQAQPQHPQMDGNQQQQQLDSVVSNGGAVNMGGPPPPPPPGAMPPPPHYMQQPQQHKHKPQPPQHIYATSGGDHWTPTGMHHQQQLYQLAGTGHDGGYGTQPQQQQHPAAAIGYMPFSSYPLEPQQQQPQQQNAGPWTPASFGYQPQQQQQQPTQQQQQNGQHGPVGPHHPVVSHQHSLEAFGGGGGGGGSNTSPYGGMPPSYSNVFDYANQWTASLDTPPIGQPLHSAAQQGQQQQQQLVQQQQQQQHKAAQQQQQQPAAYYGSGLLELDAGYARDVTNRLQHMNIGLTPTGLPPGQPAQQQQPVQQQPSGGGGGASNRPVSWADRVKAAPKELPIRTRQRGSIAGNARVQPPGPVLPPPTAGAPSGGLTAGKGVSVAAPQAPTAAPAGWGARGNVGPLVGGLITQPPPHPPPPGRNGAQPWPPYEQQQLVLGNASMMMAVAPPSHQQGIAYDPSGMQQPAVLQHNGAGVQHVPHVQHAPQQNGAPVSRSPSHTPANNGPNAVEPNNNKPEPIAAAPVKTSPVGRPSQNAAQIEPPTATTTLEKLKKETNPNELVMPPKNARYFVIKSYSEDDVHRSIKYGIWCSTDHGNKRLDTAFRQAETQSAPIFLFYSVNASGHFCGVAQMVSAVDYSKQSNVWGSDKYKGLFKVRWLYVKDVPNAQLRHIRLENNENKPVTNSRDTQEVPGDKGRQVVKVVHQFSHKTSLFDDFIHYEKKQLEEDSRRGKNNAPPAAAAAAAAE